MHEGSAPQTTSAMRLQLLHQTLTSRDNGLRQKLARKYKQHISNSLRIDIYAQPPMGASSQVVHAPGADLLAEQLQGRS